MSPSVTLSTVAGELTPPEFTIEERTTCVIGRASDCVPRIPDERGYRTVSRHHCLLDSNPPDIRIRDFGSRKGTYVNGKKIGQREQGQTPQDASGLRYPECDLSDGDLARHGATGEQIALKLMLPRLAATSNARARFMREIALARSLHHPNIVNSYGAQPAEGAFCLTQGLRGSGAPAGAAHPGGTGRGHRSCAGRQPRDQHQERDRAAKPPAKGPVGPTNPSVSLASR